MSAISRRGFFFATGGLALSGLASASFITPAEAASGSVELSITSAGFIFGATGGQGTLNFGGRRYGLTIAGVSAGATIGVSGANLYGTAHHLRRASDIAGVYSKVGANIAAIGGEQVADLVNPNGVVLNLRGRETGLMVSIDLSGMSIAIS